MYLLDTNHCSRAILRDPDVLNRLADLERSLITINAIVEAELVYMAQNSQQKDRNLVLVRGFLQDIRIYPINSAIANIYGLFAAELLERFGPQDKSKRRKTKLSSLGIGEHDLWIACTAIYHSLTVVSNDSDFTRMREVRTFPLESWYR